MTIAEKIRRYVPSAARVLLKKHYPELIERVATGLDSVPLLLKPEAWKAGPNSYVTETRQLSKKMWSGFGDRSARDLEHLKLFARNQRKTLASSAWSLAKWYATKGDYSSALSNTILVAAARPKLHKHPYVQLLMVECLLQLDRPDEALDWLEWSARHAKRKSAEFCLSAANIHHALSTREGDSAAADAMRLAWLNGIYQQAGFSRICKKNEAAPLTLDNISTPDAYPVDAPVKLSILMPAYNCEHTLPTALTSVLSQTWRNLEVIVVDDQSQDDTWAIIQDFARRDSRVIPIRHERNGGAYFARNTALAHATGEFVSVHDSDDWSHPEKFAAQMTYALSHPDGISTTVGVRTSGDFRFRPHTGAAILLVQNLSSILLKRQILMDLGGWDRTRVAADSEFYERVKARYELRTNTLFKEVPLTLIRFSQSSLTQTSATGLTSIYYGARRQYKEAYRLWHAEERAKAAPDFRMTDSRRFPAPRIILGQRATITDIDVVIVGDFADAAYSYAQDVIQWEKLTDAGLKLGIAHWPAYKHAETDIASSIRAAISSGLVENMVPGETISCAAVILSSADLLTEPPYALPLISTQHLYIAGKSTVSDEQREAARDHFGCDPLVIANDYVAPVLEQLESSIPTNFRIDGL
ncbi:glycosyltransferase family 2 protein [Microvirga soli]|uniref:glycosyltransferase family 2 protein n=1 Tax=Microvirga soli TaxID=1854496 RepID=UPI00191EFA9E|nr:glycosyltransferase family A protein [Microvirga soli]